MASNKGRLNALRGQDATRRGGNSKQSRLRIFRSLQVFVGSFKTKPSQREREGIIGFGERIASNLISLRKSLSHTSTLGPLTRK